MFTSRNKSIYLYDSTVGSVCVVPFPRFEGVNLDKENKPLSVIYDTKNHYGMRYSYIKDLRGLNVEDYEANKPALVVYELGDGSLLAANAEAFSKATFGTNLACSKGSPCYTHLVCDLELLEQLPLHSTLGTPGLPAFIF